MVIRRRKAKEGLIVFFCSPNLFLIRLCTGKNRQQLIVPNQRHQKGAPSNKSVFAMEIHILDRIRMRKSNIEVPYLDKSGL